MDNLAHKMLHTFEKMDAINPTFENWISNIEDHGPRDEDIEYRRSWRHEDHQYVIEDISTPLTNMLGFSCPFVFQVNTHLNLIHSDTK